MNRVKNYNAISLNKGIKKMLHGYIFMSIICAFQPVSSQSNTKHWQKIQASLENYRKNLKIPGIAAGIVQNGQLVWSKGFGYADKETVFAAEFNPTTEFSPI